MVEQTANNKTNALCIVGYCRETRKEGTGGVKVRRREVRKSKNKVCSTGELTGKKRREELGGRLCAGKRRMYAVFMRKHGATQIS